MSAAQPYRPQHHPDEGVLMDFAAGAAREAGAVLIATHLALCPACRRTVENLESLGGALIDELPPSPLAPDSLAQVMARLDEPAPPHGTPRRAAPIDDVPSPLSDYLGDGLDRLAWNKLAPGIETFPVAIGTEDQRAAEQMQLIRVRAGGVIPRHTHLGTEMVLVLTGGFRDGAARFRRGDFSLSDQHVDHRLLVDQDGPCVCLAVFDAPPRFTGPLGFLRNWLSRR